MFLRKWLLCGLSILLLVSSLGLSAQDEIPTVYFYNNTGFMGNDPLGSDPETLAKIQNYVIEQSGIRPETIVPPAGAAANEKLNLLLGSSDPLDVFQANWPLYANAILPLNDLLDEYGQDILNAIPERDWAGCTNSAGEIMCIPRIAAAINPYPIFLRGDWLEELGLAVPTTIDELDAVLAAFKEAHPDFIMNITGLSHLRGTTLGAFTEAGNSNWLDPADNRIKSWILQPGVQDWVAKVAEWYTKGYIPADSFATWDAEEFFRTGRVGVSAGWYSEVTITGVKYQDVNPGQTFVEATGISGPAGYATSALPLGPLGIMIAKKSQNPEAAIKLMNWVWSDTSNILTTLFGIQGEGWDWADDEQFTITRNLDYDYHGEYSFAMGIASETRYALSDPLLAEHYRFIREEIRDFSDAKLPFDFGIIYDEDRLNEAVPGRGDIQRLMDEQLVLFVTGQRPLDQWEGFLQELDQAGMQDLIDAMTVQYQELSS